jgi:SAM-dependent methyltransferase
MDSVNEQEKLFDTISASYQQHYDDPASRHYRRCFIHKPMFAGLSLQGKDVLEAMCGSGQATSFLLSQGARVTGLDLSTKMIIGFKDNYPTCNALRSSMLSSGLKDQMFDFVVVQGGLHHIQPFVEGSIEEIFRILKPGGYFLFSEPHAGSFPDIIRRLWYKKDPFFGKNERAIDLGKLQSVFRNHFDFISTRYAGAIAYLLVYNSLIFRIPLRLKSLYAPLLLRADAIIGKVQNRTCSCFVVCQWRKKNV